jgi:hypothetical protein
LRYSISSDTIQNVSFINTHGWNYLAILGNAGKSIYYFGLSDEKYRFDIQTHLTHELNSTMPFAYLSQMHNAAGVSNNETAYIFDGSSEPHPLEIKTKYIAAFDMKSETATRLGVLDFKDDRVRYAFAIVDASNSRVWLFAGPGNVTNPVLIFNMETGIVSEPEQKVSVPVFDNYKPRTVSAGRFGYVIGGFSNTPEENGTKHTMNGILR